MPPKAKSTSSTGSKKSTPSKGSKKSSPSKSSKKTNSKKGKGKGKKSAANGTKDAKKSKPKQNVSFSKYIKEVLKAQNQDAETKSQKSKDGISTAGMRISKPSRAVMDSILTTLVQSTITSCAEFLANHSQISDNDITSAVRFVIKGDLLKHALSNTAVALSKYKAAKLEEAGKKGDKENPKASRTKEDMAGLIFPISRIRKLMKKLANRVVKVKAAVVMTSVLQYITAEILQLSSVEAASNKKHTIKPIHISAALAHDSELIKLLNGGSIMGSYQSANPGINPALLPKKSKAREESASSTKSKKTPTSKAKKTPSSKSKKTSSSKSKKTSTKSSKA